MKTLCNRISYRRFSQFFTVLLLAGFSLASNGQGKKIYVGTGTGFVDYPNAQATLNLRDDDTVMINPGKYKSMTFQNITASPGHKIYIMNSGLVEFNDPQSSLFSNLTNVEVRGDGTPGIEFGFYMHDLIRGITVDGNASSLYFSYIKMANIIDYAVYIANPSHSYDGSNNANSLFYDLKFLHFSVSNLSTSFMQVGGFSRIIEDGVVNITRKLEVAYCDIQNAPLEDLIHLNKVVNANIHHNKIAHIGLSSTKHSCIVYIYGNGDVHHNYISDYWGSGTRFHAFSLDGVGAINVYNNVIHDSRKYSAVEAKATETDDLSSSSYLHYTNFKIFNNTFGNLSAYDWNTSMVDTYDFLGGTIEIKNNIGFNIQRDKPYDPTWNYIYQKLNVGIPDTANNLYFQTSAALGLADENLCMLAPGSPAIDRGQTFSFITDDIDGITRPQGSAYDLGAHEFSNGVVFPVANAGRDTATVLPKDSIKLSGLSSYNPGGGVLTYKWSQVSGPSAAVFVSDTNSSPLLKSLLQGTYRIVLTVKNTQGNSSNDTVLVVVSNVPVFPPVAKAGGTITITLPTNSTALNGAASTSTGGPLKYVWTKISGPAAFTISGDSTATPFASSLTEGTYQVQLTVTDTNKLAAVDIATIIVKPAPVPVANAGADVNLILPANSVTLNGGSSSTPGGGSLTYVWSKVSGPAAFTITGDSTVSAAVSGLVQGTYQVKLTVTNSSGISNSDFVNIVVVPAPVSVANAGTDVSITLPTSSTALNGSASYSTGGGALSYAWSKIAGPTSFTITGAATATPTISNLVAGTYQVQLTVTNTQGSSASDIVVVTVSAMPVYIPVASAGADVNITLPTNSASLNGELSYNPGGGNLTYGWSVLSGPASYSISGGSTATPILSNLTEGAYQLQLKVTNVQGSSSEDTVIVTVNTAPPAPPVSNAGNDIAITLPVNSTSLNGSSSRSADGGNLTYAWSKVSGPASFVITGQNTATPVVSSLAQGVYQLKLTVTSTQGLSAEDVVTVTVNPAAPPVASAGGADISLVLPANSATLNGGSSYDPSGGALSYSWTKVSGPASFNITGANTATPTVGNLTMGTYQVKLTVTNTAGLSASDVVNIIVTTSLLAVPNAGKDTTINFPNGYAILNGNGSYGTGGATIMRFKWEQVSGPTTAQIASSDAALTTAKNLEPGIYVFRLTVTDSYGQSETTTFKVTVISTTRYLKSISVYPNPSVNILHVHVVTDTTGPLMLHVTNMAGVMMMTKTFQKSQLLFDETIPVSQLPAGFYVVEVIMDNKIQLRAKFIKN